MWGLLYCCLIFNVLLSVIFVNRGGEFVVKPFKMEGFEFGPLRTCQEKHDEQLGFGK